MSACVSAKSIGLLHNHNTLTHILTQPDGGVSTNGASTNDTHIASYDILGREAAFVEERSGVGD